MNTSDDGLSRSRTLADLAASATWIKVRNPASIAVQRERGEIWNPMSVRQFVTRGKDEIAGQPFGRSATGLDRARR
jgi:hypothetical protein